MRKRLIGLLLLVTISTSYGQDETVKKNKPEMFIKAGLGTSWVLLPKVFLIDPDFPETNGQVLPAINGISGYIGFQSALPLGNDWLFAPGLDIAYTSGEIRINRSTINPNDNQDTIKTTVQNLQSYLRAEIPLHFGVRTKDNFWVTFGPSLYFTLADNEGFEEAVLAEPIDPNDPAKVNADNPFGVRFALSAYAPVGQRGYINIKFESDLGQYFDYENNGYKAKFSFQNISIGYGYRLNK